MSCATHADGQNAPETVSSVDIDRYIGKWYQLALIPNSFQDQCIKNTTAEYSLKDDGKIKVINACTTDDGERDRTEGTARVVDKSSNAKLEVSFFSIFGWNLFWGDYWIIGLADDYRYAIVGTPDRGYGWILSRSTQLSQEDWKAVKATLADKGYRWEQFETSKQEWSSD